MKIDFSRRHIILGSSSVAALTLAGCNTTPGPTASLAASDGKFALAYGPRPNEPFPLPGLTPEQLEPKFRRQVVNYKTEEPVGALIVDAPNFFLYHVQEGGKAMRYGVGLGRAGFEWSGRARVKWKQAWPKWFPPAEMIAREPQLEKYSAANGGHPPGLKNPLGARALYIFDGPVDTLYRLHGTNNPASIGKAISSGCVRLINQDVIHLHDNVAPGSPILVKLA